MSSSHSSAESHRGQGRRFRAKNKAFRRALLMVAGIECSIRAGDQRQKPGSTTPPGQLVRDQHEPRQLLMHIVTGFCEAEPRLTLQIMRRDLDQAELD